MDNLTQTSWESPDPRFDDVDTLCQHVVHVVVLMHYLLCNSDPSSLVGRK